MPDCLLCLLVRGFYVKNGEKEGLQAQIKSGGATLRRASALK